MNGCSSPPFEFDYKFAPEGSTNGSSRERLRAQKSNRIKKQPRRATLLLVPETLVFVAALLALLASMLLNIPLRAPVRLYSERMATGAALYATGLILAALFMRTADLRRSKRTGGLVRRSQTFRRFRRRFTYSRVLMDLRLVHAISLLFVVFIQLKHFTPFVHSGFFDAGIDAAERRLFGGLSLTERLGGILGGAPAWPLSLVYTSFYPYLAALILLAVFDRSHRAAEHSASALAILWLVSAGCIWLLPTLGPCFYQPATVAQLPPTEVTHLQTDLWRNALFVQAHPSSSAGIFLISGFPSLHVATPVLGTLLFWQRLRGFAWLSLVLAAATALATLYFGWHYLIDDLAALPLAWIALRAATGTTRRGGASITARA